MNPKRGLGLMLLLSILSTVGCASVHEPYLFRKQGPAKLGKEAPKKVVEPEADKQAELIRDLNMFAD